ncbi:hypothetical protein NC653_038548 [Populus alba x Populus x berolinensis]|uniref:Uncharacterized protein n=1 Tax=Populus alba x Populus x berolinensis TaxID=444605 RepID=A0AAD6PUC4_9ROSI|nr:hypothetical protein NC653_038548 [Populus alba x Populus x berolinensis]
MPKDLQRLRIMPAGYICKRRITKQH